KKVCGLHPEPFGPLTSFDTATQPARPFLVLEYVSKDSERKDYEDSYEKYEKDLKVPYYLLFYPDNEEVTVFRLGEKGYVTVTPNTAGRLAVPELELEAALLDGWVRFWFRGELLPLPAELKNQLDGTRAQLTVERQAREAAERAAEAERLARLTAEQRAMANEAEIARLREELAKAKGSGG